MAASKTKPVGRTPKYKDTEVDKFAAKVNEYFELCDKEDRPYTIPGLSHHMGFIDRHHVINYSKKEPFFNTIKQARQRIERQRVENLVAGKGSAAGCIFDLKNNFDYKDKTETELSGKDGGPINIAVRRQKSDSQLT